MAGKVKCIFAYHVLMEYMLLSVISSLILAISGNVEISFMKTAPRLNNSMYFDHYFGCHAQGENLQWKVNNSNISDYSGQSRLGDVFTGSISSCNYTTTLPSLKPISSGQSVFESLLIVSCQSSINFIVTCTNGSVSSMTSAPEKSLITRAENNITSVNLEHVLNENLVAAVSSSCTNVFVCGVDNLFMDWQIQGHTITFTTFDDIGVERQPNPQDGNIVEEQAILIGNEPFRLVVVMIVINSAQVNVTCGYRQNTANFASLPCPTNLGTTGSERTTVGGSSTIATGGKNDLPVVVALSVFFGVLLIIIIMVVIIIIVLLLFYQRSRKGIITARFYRDIYEPNSEIPLRVNNFSRLKKPKERINDININYDNFFERVQYIILTRNENTFNAATIILAAPDIEINTKNKELTFIDEGVYIGMIGSQPVCLVNETDSHFLEKLQKVIIQYFPNAKYLVFVGMCFGLDPKILKLADVVISKSIYHVIRRHAYAERVAPEIRSKFCFYPEKVDGLKVTEDRTAKHFVCKIASGVNILDNKSNRNFMLTNNISGCEVTSEKLLTLFQNGIDMGNNTTKKLQVISVGAVTGYVEGETVNEFDQWQFVASQAAFNYVASKMIHSHIPGNVSYDIKKPKWKRVNDSISEFAGRVKYIILTTSSDEFNAVTTHVSAPVSEEDIIEINKDIYIGMIGSHPVGLLNMYNPKNYIADMKSAIDKCFPQAIYLVHVGKCYAIDQSKADLGDVLISKTIYNIDYSGVAYNIRTVQISPEILNIFSNSHDVKGLQLPGGRTAKHFEIRIATGTGGYINKDENMKKIAIETKDNYGYDKMGGKLVILQQKMAALERKINIILINGVSGYGYNNDYSEWDFVASQAAIHYVAAKMEIQ